MLWLVGMGISGLDSIPRAGLGVLAGADIIYLEQFTSPVPSTDAAAVSALAKKEGCIIRDAKRWVVEDGAQILRDAADSDVVLLSYGDPLVATTHAELMCRANDRRIQTRVIHASSSPASVAGECGLHHYKMGRMATIMRDAKSMTTPYYIIYKNAVEGCHTLLLLEYDHEGTESGDGRSFFLEPKAALEGLVRVEAGQRRGAITDDTYAIIASRIGLEDQHVTAGTVSALVARGGFGSPPHSVVIPGRLHFTEAAALESLAECLSPPPAADSAGHLPRRIAEQMISKYAPMIRESIDEVLPHCKDDPEMLDVLRNARLYVEDAEDFIKRDGYEDVAVLSIGYADGLTDALRRIKGLEMPRTGMQAGRGTGNGWQKGTVMGT